MSDKLSIDKKEDIPKIIDGIVQAHSVNSTEMILDGLLKHYNPALLIEVIRRKIGESNATVNTSFTIGLEVYIEQNGDDEPTQVTAIKRVADRAGIKESTVATHIEAFRKTIKVEMRAEGRHLSNPKEVTEIIDKFAKEVYDKYSYQDYGDSEVNFYPPNRKNTTYKRDFQIYLKAETEVPF